MTTGPPQAPPLPPELEELITREPREPREPEAESEPFVEAELIEPWDAHPANKEEEAHEEILEGRAHLRVVWMGDALITFSDWLIEDILPARGVSMLFAPSSTGKTWLVVDWAVHVAARKSWQGRTVGGGSVLYIAAEGAYSLPERTFASVTHAEIPDIGLPIAVQREAIVFNDPTAHLILKAEDIRKATTLRGHPPISLVVVDTFTACLLGSANDDDVVSEWMRNFRIFLRLIAEPAPPAAGLLIHHPGHGHQERARGSSALPADIDCGLQLEALEAVNGNGAAGRGVVLRCTKMRDGREFEPIPLSLEPTVLTEDDGTPFLGLDGRARTALVVSPMEGTVEIRPTALEKARAGRERVRGEILAYLRTAGLAGCAKRAVRDNVKGKAATVDEELDRVGKKVDGKWFLAEFAPLRAV